MLEKTEAAKIYKIGRILPEPVAPISKRQKGSTACSQVVLRRVHRDEERTNVAFRNIRALDLTCNVRLGQMLAALRRPGQSGGALLASGEVLIDSCNLTGNQAASGPAVSNTVTVTLNSTELTGNTLLCEGDGFFLDWKEVRVCQTP